MLRSGLYKSEQDGNVFDYYKIIIEVKETEKSFVFTLIEFDTQYGATQMENLFQRRWNEEAREYIPNKRKVTIKKDKGGHAIRIWGEDNFTFYPYQAGVPFYFELVEW